jgi:acetoin utilization deacetylase AcuC-like enzyme
MRASPGGNRTPFHPLPMKIFFSPNHTLHDPGVLPQPEGGSHNYYSEVAQRGTVILESLRGAQLGALLEPPDRGLASIEAVHSQGMVTLLRTAYERMVHEVHGGNHHPRVVLPETFAVRRTLEAAPRSIWAHLGYHCYDTSSPIFAHTWTAAYWAAQTALAGAQALYAGETAAYALCRPPGHHAGHDMFGGFCYLNNAAIAAQWLAASGGRVAVLDVDFHHGNGTQEIFYERSDVLTVSLHVDPHSEYPYFWGHADEVGAGVGAGHNLNLPLALGTELHGYLLALEVAVQRIRDFAPGFLVVSLGVDTFEGDPVGGFRLQTADFPRLGAAVRTLGVPTLVVQEGGYALGALGLNVVGFLRGLLDG